MASKLKESLNSAQLKAVKSETGAYLVIAGAGTGKTRVLTYRVAYLVENGVNPENILLLTFTRKAASEMIERAKKLSKNSMSGMEGGTFHSFCAKILRKYADRVGFSPSFTILDESDSVSLMRYLRTQGEYAKDDPYFPKAKTILNLGSSVVNRYMQLADILQLSYPQIIDYEEKIKALLTSYRRYKIEHNLMDFDDLLIWARELLIKNPDIADRLSRKYMYIMVDEYQDTNPLQAQISDILATIHKNIMVVGDDCQSIYRFRGADFKNIMEFPLRYKKVKIIRLERNYRSTQPILSFTNRLIEKMDEKYEKSLYTESNEGEKPTYVSYRGPQDEADAIVQEIISLRDGGLKLSEVAVLYRANWISNALERSLNVANIAYEKYGGLRFLERAHVKDVLAYVAAAANPKDFFNLKRCLNLIPGVGEATSASILEKVSKDGLDGLVDGRLSGKKYFSHLVGLKKLLEGIRQKTREPVYCVQNVCDFYTPYLAQSYIEDAEERMPDLEELASMASKFEDITGFLENLTLEPPNRKDVKKRENADSLVLSTIHQAKGLEWEHVFIIGLNDGQLPHKRCMDDPEELEEELRLFYVACTRAKKMLHLSRSLSAHPPHDGAVWEQSESRFLEDTQDLIERMEDDPPDTCDPFWSGDFFTPANQLKD